MHPREGLVHAEEATDLMGEEVLRDAGGAGGGSLGELPRVQTPKGWPARRWDLDCTGGI